MSRRPTFSVVIETANVGPQDPLLRRSLTSIAGQGALLHEANEIVLLAEPDTEIGQLSAITDDYPFLRVERSPGGGYGAMKAHAAHVTTGDVIVFADSDCTYAQGWLRSLLDPLLDPAVDGVTGETAIAARGPYSLAVAATFNFPGFSGDSAVASSERYWANNVALRRGAVLSLAAPQELSRGSCVLHAQELRDAGRVLARHPGARCYHAVIAPREFPGRYISLGRDNATLARSRSSGPAQRLRVPAFPPDRDRDAPLAKVARRLGRTVARRPPLILFVPLALPVVVAAAALHAVGRRLPPRHVPRAAP